MAPWAWHNDRRAGARTAGPRCLRVGRAKTIGPTPPDRFTGHVGAWYPIVFTDAVVVRAGLWPRGSV